MLIGLGLALHVDAKALTDSYEGLYLRPGGSLSTTKPSSPGADTVFWGGGMSLSYTVTSPRAVDTTLLGPAAVNLWVTSTSKNVQLYLPLQDVAPDGSASRVTHGSFLASRNNLDPVRSWTAANGLPVRPWLTLDADRYLTPNLLVKLSVPLEPVTWRLKAGHRLRLPTAGLPSGVALPQGW